MSSGVLDDKYIDVIINMNNLSSNIFTPHTSVFEREKMCVMLCAPNLAVDELKKWLLQDCKQFERDFPASSLQQVW
jgi:hypothetical protein